MEQEQMVNGNDGAPATGPHDRKPEPRDLSRPAFPRAAERAGITTSAMMRDATRLRTVMTRSAGDGTVPESSQDRSGADTEPADQGTMMYAPSEEEIDIEPEIGIPLPDLKQGDEYSGYDMPGISSQPEPDHTALEKAGYGATKIVMPKRGDASSGYRFESSHLIPEPPVATGSATRLRPVAALGMIAAGSATSIANAVASEPRISPAGAPAHRESHVDITEPQESVSAAYNDRWDAAAAAATPKAAGDSWRQPRQQRYTRPGGGLKRGAVAAAMVLAGTTIGIGLYIGGNGFLSGFFSNKNEGVATLSPSAVTELPQTLVPEEPLSPAQASVPDPALSSETGSAEHTVPLPTSVDKPIASASQGQRQPDAPSTAVASADNAGKKPSQPKPESARPPADPAGAGEPAGRTDVPKSPEKPKVPARAEEKGGNGKKDDPKTAPGAVEERVATAGKYIVQVRATSDESEANLIARKLRKKGISDVQVVRSEKNGAPFYRIRFVAAGTSDQAQEKAKSAGFADAWVVRQK